MVESVDRGAKIGTQNVLDETALSMAKLEGHTEIIEFLLASDPAVEREPTQETVVLRDVEFPSPDNPMDGAVPVYPGTVFFASEQPRAFKTGEFAGVPADQLSTVEGEAPADVKTIYDFYEEEVTKNKKISWLVYEAEYGLGEDGYYGFIRGNDYRKNAFEIELFETESGTYIYFTMGPHS